MSKSVLSRIAAIQKMDRNQLREKWLELFGTEAPETYNSKTLKARLTYRVQELAFGGLSEETRQRLEQLGGDIPQAATPKKSKRQTKNRPAPGTKLIREYKGSTYVVTVTETGFEYQGRPYKSLSRIAREITGNHWSGNYFFGLTKGKKKSQ